MDMLSGRFQWVIKVCIVLCFAPFVSPVIGLLVGIILSLSGVRGVNTKLYTSWVLKASVVLIGFGTNLTVVLKASQSGFVITAVSVVSIMILGIILGKLVGLERKTTVLISAGTAICGGSAIAALSPVLKSEEYQSSFALIVVFVLNAVSLFIFPYLGCYFGMSQEVFGKWVAIAIHDTSSVVGAGAQYGDIALHTATTVKLIRALWIIPLSFVVTMFKGNRRGSVAGFPWFILLFVLAIVVSNMFPVYKESYNHLSRLGNRGMVLALFLIGNSINISDIRRSGIRPFVVGVVLWVLTSVVSFVVLNS
jgi:uncharacterized integral membrane protein (TIGR00698 family)